MAIIVKRCILNDNIGTEVDYMQNQFLTNYTEVTFLDKLKDNLRRCSSFSFSVSFIKKAGLVLLFKDIEAAVERGATGRHHLDLSELYGY